eukprot:scaffold9500_cov195-Skeletonema_marinoi.AAC.1
MAIYDGSLEAVDCLFVCHLSFRATVLPQLLDYRVQRVVLLLTHTLCKREIRYGARDLAGVRLIWPHQVTYDVVATPIRSINA